MFIQYFYIRKGMGIPFIGDFAQKNNLISVLTPNNFAKSNKNVNITVTMLINDGKMRSATGGVAHVANIIKEDLEYREMETSNQIIR